VDDLGDIEEVVKVTDVSSEDFEESYCVVAIKAKDLYEYTRLAAMGLVFYFDFTRFRLGSFNGWTNPRPVTHTDTSLDYHGGVQSASGSFVNGRFVAFPPVTKREITRRYKERRPPRKRQYASFKMTELRSGELIEAGCDPSKVSNWSS
jgi:hypothetical protein